MQNGYEKQLRFIDLKNDKLREKWLEANLKKDKLLETSFFRAYATPKLPDGTYFITLEKKQHVLNPNYYNVENEPMFNVGFSNYHLYEVKIDKHTSEEYIEETSKVQAIKKMRELRK